MDLYLCFFCCFSFVSCSVIVLFFLLCSVKGGSQSSTNLPSKSNYSHHLPGGMNYITNIIMQNLIQRLRSLVGLKGWDFCVLWKQSEDQRFIKWMDCCCSGTETTQINGTGQDLVFPVTPVLPCRDTMLQHPRTRSCDLLAKMPSSMPLDSGIYAQTLISNQPSWLNFSNNTCLSALEEDVGTRVLIPIPGGLIELLVAKQVLEDQQVIDFITAQYNISLEQGALINTMSEIQSQRRLFEDGNHDQMDPNNHFQQPPTNSLENLNLPYDHHHHHVSMGRIFPSSNSHPINFVQQFTYNLGNKVKINNNVAFEDSSHDHKPFLSDKQMDYAFNFSADHQIGFEEMEAMQRSMMSGDHQTQHMHMQYMEPLEPDDMDQQEGNYEKDTNLHEVRQADLVSDCSDQIDGEEDAKCRRRTGKGPQAKNLVAERNRRKKLNARLYNLRSLVPIISKLDRASILGDAIEYVQELQKQAKQLQDELDDHAEDEGAKKSGITCPHNNKTQSKIQSQSGLDDLIVPKTDQHHEDHNKASNGFHLGTPGDGSPDSDVIHDHKTQQMEPQVEVAQLDGNQFYVKVFCEHKFGGFGKLMEALSSLSLEVTNANVTSFTCLVSNVFIVEKKDSGIVEADEVRDSLLELTRNPTRWRSSNMAKAAENGVRLNNHHDHHLHNHHFDPFHLQHLPNEA